MGNIQQIPPKLNQQHQIEIDLFIETTCSVYPPKLNIASEKSWLEDEFPIRKITFLG